MHDQNEDVSEVRSLQGDAPACYPDPKERRRRNDAAGLETAPIQSLPQLNYTAGQFRALAGAATGPTIVPLGCELPLSPHSPAQLYTLLAGPVPAPYPRQERDGPRGYLLESLEGDPRSARYTFIGVDPLLSVRLLDPPAIDGDEKYLRIARPALSSDPVTTVRSLLSAFPMVAAEGPRLICGFVGYFPYEFVRATIPRLAHDIPPPGETPLGEFILPRTSLSIDHHTHRMYLYAPVLVVPGEDPENSYREGFRTIRSACRLIGGPGLLPGDSGEGEMAGRSVQAYRGGTCRQHPERDAFCESVTRVREHILAGDIFQAVISTRIEGAVEGSPLALYERLRQANPSPYHYFLDLGEQCICGASPEMLVRVEDGHVTTVPIAGTRPRGSTLAEDARLGRELLADPKERAEHTMLVDLARNDLGRVCRFGTVRVDGFMTLESYSHVQHLVTTVTGDLAPDRDPLDAFISCFPAGTVTGAPKIRAMEIIQDVEGEPRGVYAGAVGYFALNGPLEFAIAIRTAVIRDGYFSVQAGAGIVADSVPSREWEEASQKAGALLAALGCGGGRP